jgi:fucose 4-O-acetylase-like acetyltransferase
MKRNDDINNSRALLILLVILVHIVPFTTLHPQLKVSILAFMMPTFLLITGYLVNVKKDLRRFGIYYLGILVPYIVMTVAYSVASYFLPVRDGIHVLSVNVIMDKILVTSIGPYWFLHTMLICGLLYYACFTVPLHKEYKIERMLVFGILLLLLSIFTPLLSLKIALFYFIGALLRQTECDFTKVFYETPLSLVPFCILISNNEFYDWGLITVLILVYCFISFSSWIYGYLKGTKINKYIIILGMNTFPVYIFHPVFTMAAKFYKPLLAFEPSGCLLAVVTLVLAVLGSILVAWILDKTKMCYLLGKKKILRFD